MRASAARWLGTPFRERTALCRVGADCVGLVRSLMVECGLPVLEIGVEYPLDWATHSNRSLLVDWIARTGLCAEAPPAPLQAGDVVCIRQGRCPHHLVVMLDDRRLVHVMVGRVVEEGLIEDPWFAKRIDRVFRPLEVAC